MAWIQVFQRWEGKAHADVPFNSCVWFECFVFRILIHSICCSLLFPARCFFLLQFHLLHYKQIRTSTMFHLLITLNRYLSFLQSQQLQILLSNTINNRTFTPIIFLFLISFMLTNVLLIHFLVSRLLLHFRHRTQISSKLQLSTSLQRRQQYTITVF